MELWHGPHLQPHPQTREDRSKKVRLNGGPRRLDIDSMWREESAHTALLKGVTRVVFDRLGRRPNPDLFVVLFVFDAGRVKFAANGELGAKSGSRSR